MAKGNYYANMLNDAAAEVRGSTRMNEKVRKIDEMANQMARLDMIVCAMWELLQENGISKETLYNKIDELISTQKTKTSHFTRIDCPKCGKPVQESNKMPMLGRCVYCGTMLTFYPYSDDVAIKKSADDADEAPDYGMPGQDSFGDDLGF